MEQWREDVLIHYGILGMKWGIRRYQPYSTRPRSSGQNGKEIGEARKSAEKKISLNVSTKTTSQQKAKQSLKEYSADKFVKSDRYKESFNFLKDLASDYKERGASKEDIKNLLTMEAYETNIDEYFLDFLYDTSLKNESVETLTSLWNSDDFNKETHKLVDKVVKKAME